jgi:hypothetical protein
MPSSLKVRPEVEASLVVKHDVLGRKVPKPLGSLGILSAAIACGMPAPKPVPGEFWALDLNDDGYSCAVVSCPCGHTPSVEVGTLEECECERYFFFAGESVQAFNSPQRAPGELAQS